MRTIVLIAISIMALLVGVVGYLLAPFSSPLQARQQLSSWLVNVSLSLLLVVFTYVFLDILLGSREHQEKEERERSIKQIEMISQLKQAILHEPVRIQTILDAGQRLNLFQGIDLCGLAFNAYHFDRFDFSRANLEDVCPQEATFRQAIFHKVTATRINVSYSDCSHVSCIGAIMHQAKLMHTKFHHATLTGTSLYQADVTFAEFNHAHLSGVSFIGANCNHANFSFADLRHADLSGINLCGASLLGAQLQGAILTQIQCDTATTLPDGTAYQPGMDITTHLVQS